MISGKPAAPGPDGGASTGHEASPRLLGLLDRRHAEEPLELPAELRRALVPDRPRYGARIVAVVGHQLPRMVGPDSLEILKRRPARHELEVMVEGCDAHARPPGHLLGTERPCVLAVDVPQDPSDAGEVDVPTSQRTQGSALLSLEHPIDDFA